MGGVRSTATGHLRARWLRLRARLLYQQLDWINREVKAANGSEMDLVMRPASEVFMQEFFSDLKAHRSMTGGLRRAILRREIDLHEIRFIS